MSDFLKRRERERKLEKVRGKARNGNGNGNGARGITIPMTRAEATAYVSALDNASDAFDNDSTMRREAGDEEDQQYIDANDRDDLLLQGLATRIKGKLA